MAMAEIHHGRQLASATCCFDYCAVAGCCDCGGCASGCRCATRPTCAPTAAPTAAPTDAPTDAPTAVQITGDPHIRFAEGGIADFRGRDDKLYNIVSASNVSLAMKTRDTTFWMLRDGKKQVVHGSFFTEAHFVLFDNQDVFYLGIDARKRGFVVKNRKRELIASYKEWQCFDKLVQASACIRQLTLNVTTVDWEFAITRRPIYNKMSGPSYYRLDVEIKRRKDSAIAHGIIGQSWDNDGIAISGKKDDYSTDEVFTTAMAEGAIEGDASDYELKDEYHTGFKYSCFTGGQSKEMLSMLGIPHQCAIRNVSRLTGKRAVAATNASGAFTSSD